MRRSLKLHIGKVGVRQVCYMTTRFAQRIHGFKGTKYEDVRFRSVILDTIAPIGASLALP